VRTAAINALIACGFVWLVAWSTDVSAEDDAANRFRVVFQDGQTTPVTGGIIGEQNRRAIVRMGQLLSVWPAASPLSFILVSRKAAACRGGNSCNADQILWQRANASVAAAAAAAKGMTVRYNLVRQNFIEDVAKGVVLPPAPTGYAALDLRIYVEDGAQKSVLPGNCPWALALKDGDLPPAISTRGALTDIAVSHGQAIAVGRAARLRVRGLAASAPEVAGIWEDAEGALCRAQINGAGELNFIPPSAQRLLLMAAQPSDPKLRSQLENVPPTCPKGSDPRRSVMAQANNTAANKPTRGVGDDPRTVTQGSIQPAPSATLCTIGLVALPTIP
jgi:hypothetical protein